MTGHDGSGDFDTGSQYEQPTNETALRHRRHSHSQSAAFPRTLERSEPARCLGSTIKLTFLSYALVRLGGAPYSILKLVIFGRQ